MRKNLTISRKITAFRGKGDDAEGAYWRGGGAWAKKWHPQPDSNRCYQDENLMS